MTIKKFEQEMEEVADFIVKSKRIVVFTGAGVSTESGIPDFRSPDGIWSKYNPYEFTYQRFIEHPIARRKMWQMLLETGMAKKADPNPAHWAIAELYKLGNLDCVITQNVDNLHQIAGVPEDRVFELHGNMQWVICLGCGKRYPLAEIIPAIEKNEDLPDCEFCHGVLKPDAVFFGEPLPEKVLNEAISRSNSCDLFIVIGSSLVVYPAAFMPTYAVNSGARLVIINLTSTPMDDQATILIRAKAGEAMSQIVKKIRKKSKVIKRETF